MRRTILLVLLATLNSYASDTLKLDSKLERVTVFFEGAELFASTPLNLAPGVHIIQIKGLASSLDPESIKVQGEDGLLIHGVNHFLIEPNVYKNETFKKLESTIRKTSEAQVQLAQEYEVYRLEQEILLDNRKLNGGESGLTAAQIREAATMFRNSLNEIRLKQAKIYQQIEANRKKIESTRKELNALAQDLSETENSVLVKLENAAWFKGRLKLSYYTPLAGWTANYDIRVERLSEDLELVYKAAVFQTSGLDWDQVMVKLSTENPKQNRDRPDLEVWRLPNAEQQSFHQEPLQASRLKIQFFNQDGQPLSNVSLTLRHSTDQRVYQVRSDANGFVNIKPLMPGSYSVRAEYFGLKSVQTTIQVNNPETRVEITMTDPTAKSNDIRLSNFSPSFSSDDIQSMAVRDISSVAGQAAGVTQDFNGQAQIRGARGEGTVYFIDGVKVRGSVKLPQAAISSNLVTGGAPRRTVNFEIMASSSSTDISNLEYQIRKAQTIPSNGIDYSINMQLKKIPVSYVFEIIPKLDPRAYLYAEIIHWEELKLLTGPARIYINGSYVGQNNIDVSAVKDTFKLALGQDRGINVERRPGKEITTEGIFGEKISRVVEWDIEVRNLKSEKVQLRVRDQIPLSDRTYIEITALNIGSAKQEEKTGELVWEFDLEPEASEVLNFRYQVRYPRKVSADRF